MVSADECSSTKEDSNERDAEGTICSEGEDINGAGESAGALNPSQSMYSTTNSIALTAANAFHMYCGDGEPSSSNPPLPAALVPLHGALTADFLSRLQKEQSGSRSNLCQLNNQPSSVSLKSNRTSSDFLVNLDSNCLKNENTNEYEERTVEGTLKPPGRDHEDAVASLMGFFSHCHKAGGAGQKDLKTLPRSNSCLL